MVAAVIALLRRLLLSAEPGLHVQLDVPKDSKVSCSLYEPSAAKAYPKDARRAKSVIWCSESGRCDFGALPSGTYAVACFHDLNRNGVLDRGMFGIPSEPTVASNHAKGFMGPPSFDDAKFTFDGELTLQLKFDK